MDDETLDMFNRMQDYMNAGLMNAILAFCVIYFFIQPDTSYLIFRCCCKGYKKYKGDEYNKGRKEQKIKNK